MAAPTPRRRFRMREFAILASVLLAIAVFGSLNPRFLGLESALAILERASSDGFMVIVMTIVIVCGAFDMSVGSSMAFCGLVAAMAVKTQVPVPLAIVGALAAGAFVGWTNGMIVTRLKINPFVTTLGMMSILRGVVQVITPSAPPTGFPESFLKIAWGTVFTIRLPWGPLKVRFPVVLLVAAMIAGDFLLRRLTYLRQVYFVGSNEEAARLTGIPTARVKTFAFMLTGFLAGLTGVSAVFTGPPTVDANAQIESVNRPIAQKVDGIIMCAVADAVTPAIDKAIEAGIPVVCADADAPSSKRFSFISTGNYNAGYQAASNWPSFSAAGVKWSSCTSRAGTT